MAARPMPGYWINETSGVLRPAVEGYLGGPRAFRPEHAAPLRSYLKQWMEGDWMGADELRAAVPALATWKDFATWFEAADALFIDPL